MWHGFTLIRKGNPYHDAEGKFTSAGGEGEGATKFSSVSHGAHTYTVGTDNNGTVQTVHGHYQNKNGSTSTYKLYDAANGKPLSGLPAVVASKIGSEASSSGTSSDPPTESSSTPALAPPANLQPGEVQEGSLPGYESPLTTAFPKTVSPYGVDDEISGLLSNKLTASAFGQSQFDNFTDNEQGALKSYQSNSDDINTDLRRGFVPEDAALIDGAFGSEATTLPESIEVTRGVSLGSFAAAFPNGLYPGAEITDSALFSSSLARSVAEQFASKNGLVLKVTIPSGTKAIVFPDQYEREVLLQRGTSLRITSIARGTTFRGMPRVYATAEYLGVKK